MAEILVVRGGSPHHRGRVPRASSRSGSSASSPITGSSAARLARGHAGMRRSLPSRSANGLLRKPPDELPCPFPCRPCPWAGRRPSPRSLQAARVAAGRRAARLGTHAGGSAALLRGERDALAHEVDLEHAHLDLVARPSRPRSGSFTKLIGQLRDVDEAVLVDADVDEGAEGRDVGDHAFELHARLEILELAHVVAELGRLERGARIAARLLQLARGCRSA